MKKSPIYLASAVFQVLCRRVYQGTENWGKEIDRTIQPQKVFIIYGGRKEVKKEESIKEVGR